MSILLFLSLGACNLLPVPVPVGVDVEVNVPATVPVTEGQVAMEAERFDKLEEPVDAQTAFVEMVERANTRYNGKPFAVLMAGTDSMNGGKDGWRTCAKLKPEQLGVPSDTLAVFFNKDRQPCDKHPDDYVMMMVLAGPVGLEKAVIDPVYKNERMTVMVASTVAVNGP